MKKHRSKEKPPAEERWRVVQVAGFLGISPQTARNRMLQKHYGPSVYDERTRILTVRADAVREHAEKLKNTHKNP